MIIEENLYDHSYYKNYNGKAYGRTPEWLSFFGVIADNIISTLNPETVLDVGCAYGLLVETLRDKGIDAFGIDISDYAIGQARADIRKYLKVGSIVEPIQTNIDLIVTIEVVEHIKEEDCDTIINNLCRASNRVLIATTPDDFDDPTHFNVNAPLYWIQKFSKFGFEPDISYDAGYLTPYAMLFKKSKVKVSSNIHRLFGEKKLLDLEYSRVVHQKNINDASIVSLNQKLLENDIELNDLGARFDDLETRFSQGQIQIESLQKHIVNLHDSISIEKKARLHFQSVTQHYESILNKYHSSFIWKCGLPIRAFLRFVQLFKPLFPKVVAGNKGRNTLSFSSEKIQKWGLVQANFSSKENVPFGLTMDVDGEQIRLSALPISIHGATKYWLVKARAEAENYEVNILGSSLTDLKIIKINTLSSWVKLINYRWKVGGGSRSALRFSLRLLGHVTRGNLESIVEEFWPTVGNDSGDYNSWLLQHDSKDFSPELQTWLEGMRYQPLISIILPTFNSNIELLKIAVESVKAQSYKNWELCITDDASDDSKLKEWIKSLAKQKGIKVNFRDTNGHISAASNTAVESAAGDFIAFLDHDDELHPNALAAVVGELNFDKNIDLIYSDEDKIDMLGNRTDPHFKSDWNPDLFLSQNYICHLVVVRRALVEKVGGFRVGFEGAQDYDLLLRITEATDKIQHIPLVLYHWRMVEGSTALNVSQKSYAHERAQKALQEAIIRRKIKAKLMPSGLGVFHRVNYLLPDPKPLVSIIIPTRDHVELVKTCIQGLSDKNNYDNWELLIIDNDSQFPESHDYFENIKSERIRVLKYPGQFNYSAINNFGVKKAHGEIILLLNNDIEMIEPNWLIELVSQAIRPEIGAVGARLYYPDDRVQHDGIIVGIGGVAGYAHWGIHRSDVAAFGGSRLIRNYTAVTAAVLAIRRQLFLDVGGLDEENLAVAFNDVDLCLRIQKAGYRNLFTPYAELYHHESISRGADIGPEKAERFEKEANFMKARWLNVINNDPNYNPNLSLENGFSLDVSRGQNWPWQNK